jgi:hypothetical protein
MSVTAKSRALRSKMIAKADSLEADLVTAIKEPFRNNILWSLGHVAVTTGLLVQVQSGLPHPLGDEAVAAFRKGTTGADIPGHFGFEQVKGWLTGILDTVDQDLEAGRLANFEPYQTSAGVPLGNAEEAIDFLPIHDGLHLGYILAQARAISF